MTAFLVPVLAGYLLGALSGGRIAGRISGTDLTATGTKNPGASNAAMVLGKKWGAFTCLFDIGKTLCAYALAAWALDAGHVAGCAAAAASVFGHCWPVWHKFRGGKGYACYVGLMLASDWRMALSAVAAGAALALLADSMMGLTFSSIVLAPPAAFALHGTVPAACLLAASLVVLVRHAENIGNLRSRTEPSLRDALAGKYLDGAGR